LDNRIVICIINLFLQVKSNDKLHFVCVYCLLIFYYICYQYNRLNINEIIVIDYFKVDKIDNEINENKWTDNILIEEHIDYTSVKDNDFIHIITNTDFNYVN
jgi:hypothetical protein